MDGQTSLKIQKKQKKTTPPPFLNRVCFFFANLSSCPRLSAPTELHQELPGQAHRQTSLLPQPDDKSHPHGRTRLRLRLPSAPDGTQRAARSHLKARVQPAERARFQNSLFPLRHRSLNFLCQLSPSAKQRTRVCRRIEKNKYIYEKAADPPTRGRVRLAGLDADGCFSKRQCSGIPTHRLPVTLQTLLLPDWKWQKKTALWN